MALDVEIDGVFSDGLADTVLYNAGTGAVEVQGILDFGSLDGEKPGRQASILVQKSEVVSPEYRHTFEINGETWTVAPEKGKDFVLDQTSTAWSLRIERDGRSTQWRR